MLEHSAKRLAIFGAVVLGVAWLLSSTTDNCRHAHPGISMQHCSSRMTSSPSAFGSHDFLLGLIAETSGSLWLNVPAAALVVGVLTWVSLGGGGDKQMHMGGSWRTRRFDSQGAPRDYKPPGSAAGAQKADARWRDKVRAPLVEHAWETLCGSIIQEVGVLSGPLPPTAGTACSVSC